ncbi:MAG TPA: glycogen synthase GlgA [Rhabdochlamydiaceae bacterium]|jgi:starch synthase
MYIVHVATELAPIAKVGGLGDVIHGLSRELLRLGHSIEIILPKYDCLHFEGLKNLKVEFRELWSIEGTQRYNNTIWSAMVDELPVILIEPHHPLYYFSRGIIYGCHDDIDRFIYFSRTAMEYLLKSGKMPDVIHAHDWPTALIPVLQKELYAPLGYKTNTALSIHNMEHQGKCQLFNLAKAGLRGESYLHPDKMQDPHFPNLLNLLKGGIVYADRVITVSPTYEKEIQTLEGGFGLQDTIVKHRKKLSGILNGIDEQYWNPQSDPHLIKPYSTHNVHTEEQLKAVLEAKKENARQLRVRCNIKEENKPLVASVTRLVAQKAPHLIKHALLHTVEQGGQFILLGSASPIAIAQEFELLSERLSRNDQVRILLDKDESLAHLIFAAADMFIIPSLFEPCGLTQLIALRYGTLPIARKTGGLSDTVFDIDTSSLPLAERNGFTFDFPDIAGVNWALDRAITCYKTDPRKWGQIISHAIRMDFSWKSSAKNYIAIYETLQTAAKPLSPFLSEEEIARTSLKNAL